MGLTRVDSENPHSYSRFDTKIKVVTMQNIRARFFPTPSPSTIEPKRSTELGRQGPVIDIDTEEEELTEDLPSNTVDPGSWVKLLQPPPTLKVLHPLLKEQGDGGRAGAGVDEKEANVGAKLQEEVVRQGAVEVLWKQVAVVGL